MKSDLFTHSLSDFKLSDKTDMLINEVGETSTKTERHVRNRRDSRFWRSRLEKCSPR